MGLFLTLWWTPLTTYSAWFLLTARILPLATSATDRAKHDFFSTQQVALEALEGEMGKVMVSIIYIATVVSVVLITVFDKEQSRN